MNEHYYNNGYKEKLKKILQELKVFEKYENNEWKPPSYHEINKDLIKMCSVASSSKLTFLYFYDQIVKNEVEVERECDNGLKGYKPQLDAYDKNKRIFYECKCHEICSTNHNKLKDKYAPILESEGLFNIDMSCVSIDADEEENEKYLDLTMNDLGCENKEIGNKSIYNLHLDVKQLICHLIGIQNEYSSDNEKSYLQYIFFTPSENKINDKINKLYEELKNEWEIIINSEAFNNFKKNNVNIEIKDPEFIAVDMIKDVVLNQ